MSKYNILNEVYLIVDSSGAAISAHYTNDGALREAVTNHSLTYTNFIENDNDIVEVYNFLKGKTEKQAINSVQYLQYGDRLSSNVYDKIVDIYEPQLDILA